MLTEDNNQPSFLLPLSSPSSPSDLFPSFPLSISLCVSLSFTPCDPQVCPLVCSLLESLDAEYVKNRIGKSQLGEMVRGHPMHPYRGGHAALCQLHRQVWSGDPGEVEDPSLWASQVSVAGGVPADWGPLRPLRGSIPPLSHWQNLLPRTMWQRGQARSGFKSWIFS